MRREEKRREEKEQSEHMGYGKQKFLLLCKKKKGFTPKNTRKYR